MAERQTFTTAHVRRERAAHLRTDGYGRHRHLYLHDTIRGLARRLAAASPEPSWLDYGCGKGAFMEQVRPFGCFGAIAGYDPAVAAFETRPDGPFDLVTCLDVLDKAEPRFVPAVIADVAALTGGLAVFDCLTMPRRDSGLRPHPPFYWSHLVRAAMDVVETKVEFAGMQDFERAVVVAAPRGSG